MRWEKRIFDKSLPSEIDDLELTVDYLLDDMTEHGYNWGMIDLSNLNVDTTNLEHLSVILRTLFHTKDKIKGWEHAIDVVKKLAIINGLDVNDVLYGF